MTLFISLLFYYILCIIFERSIKKGIGKKAWMVVLLFPMILIVALRDITVGNDTSEYFKLYNEISNTPFLHKVSSRLEVGYILVMRFFTYLGISYFTFQMITSFFIYFSIGRFIYKYSSHFALSVFSFMTLNLFFQTMNISRQFLAIAILTYSIKYILERKLFKFSIVVIIAMLFHKTALVFFLLYFIVNGKWATIKKIILLITGIFISVYFESFLYFTSDYLGEYENYLEGRYFQMEGKFGVYILLSIYFIFLLLGLFFKYGRVRLNDSSLTIVSLKKEKIFLSAVIITVILAIIGLNSTIITRLISYFLIFFIIYIPNVINLIKNKNLRILVAYGIIVFLCLYYIFILLLRPEWTGIIPYSWYMDF